MDGLTREGAEGVKRGESDDFMFKGCVVAVKGV